MMLRLPRIVKDFGRTMDQAGYESYLVGGAVRNLLRHEKPADYDVTTNATPAEVTTVFRRVIPTGVRHGTVTVLFKGTAFEVTTYRSEGEYSDSRRPDSVTFVPSLDEDLKRRDFTINAIAVDTVTGNIVDPHHGRKDLQKGLIRAIGIPRERFAEDGLRLLRACRFSCQLSFSIDENTLSGIAECRENIRNVSAERIRDELDKILLSPTPSTGFLSMEKTGLLEIILPELSACRGVEQFGEHEFDVLDHSLYSCDGASPTIGIRLAALFHDIGKPASRKELPDGTVVFHGHDQLSGELAGDILRRLKYPKKVEREVTHLIRNHMFSYSPEWTDAAVRRFIRRVGVENVEDLFALRIADGYGMRRRTRPGDAIPDLRRRIRAILEKEHAISMRDLQVNGEDLADAGIPKGPEMGTVLEFLLETVIDDPDQNRHDRLIEMAVRFYNQHIARK